MNSIGIPGRQLSIGRLVFVGVVVLAAVLLLTQLEAPEGDQHCTVRSDWRMNCAEREP